ncbi:carbohydrate ABC transporter permease [Picrophilus oshimae]|uniref:Carbohydrate ABC transporter membrane protein 1, CUT1 family n=1 Tax=Picrophilus torridus (strain ATCC 700027 / DSM 9790 / JCM 10055 / NBRC 100828 / KAW 2/3) TaxID=1122961 RepID=Q6L082_PICTO|nr:sugar ABC transporter permease [Picrophilus oshimae]AAT43620.1 sugar ABC transporter 1, permease protein [Picrophilus oshimae DSM 9789]SMD31248.1 carbohydrate ABC transporter membrane protein 1, CUT1 family [Picrophilus oshimae DSM 9789]
MRIGRYKYLLFVLPALVYVLVFSFFPAASVVYLSFKSHGNFTLSNYQGIIKSDLAGAIGDTLIVSIGALFIQLFFAILIANILIKSLKGNKVFSTIFIIPYGISTVVAAFVFSLILSPLGGFANSTLVSLGLKPVDWYSNYYSELGVVMFSDFWKNTPLVALILYGGLSGIPPSISEAASVDGAGPFRRFIYITLPNLAPYIAIALLIRGVSEFNIFALPLVLIGYYPPLMNTLVYEFFTTPATTPYAYAAATILLIIILVFAFIIIKLGGASRYEK